MSATPYRKDFYAKLGANEKKVCDELDRWLAALEAIVTILKAFLAEKKIK